jgi:hypothetical protein
VGKGSHYRTGTDYRNGTTAISTRLLNDLRHKTTYPPTVLNNNFQPQGNYTLLPQVPRGAGTTSLDLGYLYDPIDYAVSNLIIDNATCTILPGTVLTPIATVGIRVRDNGKLVSQGMPRQPVRFVRHPMVQEQQGNWTTSQGTMRSIVPHNLAGSATAALDLRFTEFYAMPGALQHIASLTTTSTTSTTFKEITLADCRFKSSSCTFSGIPAIQSKNNLFERASVTFQTTGSVDAHNSLFYGGTVTYSVQGSPAWTFLDRLSYRWCAVGLRR